MRNKLRVGLFSVLLALSPCTFAQTSYLCITTKATGFTYEPNGTWEVSKFNTSEMKDILRKTANGWEWLSLGQKSGMPCADFNKDGYLNCDLLFGTLRVNKNTLRFIETYTVGYVDGANNNSNTPAIKIGKCSPI